MCDNFNEFEIFLKELLPKMEYYNDVQVLKKR